MSISVAEAIKCVSVRLSAPLRLLAETSTVDSLKGFCSSDLNSDVEAAKDSKKSFFWSNDYDQIMITKVVIEWKRFLYFYRSSYIFGRVSGAQKYVAHVGTSSPMFAPKRLFVNSSDRISGRRIMTFHSFLVQIYLYVWGNGNCMKQQKEWQTFCFLKKENQRFL